MLVMKSLTSSWRRYRLKCDWIRDFGTDLGTLNSHDLKELHRIQKLRSFVMGFGPF
jgi:hypothetical protein